MLGNCEMKSCREMSVPGLFILQLLLLLLLQLTSSVFIVSASETLSGTFGGRHPPGVDRRSGDRVVFESAPPGPRPSRGSASKSPPDCEKTESNDRARGEQQTQPPGDDVGAAAGRHVPVGAPPPPKSSGRIILPPPTPVVTSPPFSKHR